MAFTPTTKMVTGSGTTPALATTAINTALAALTGTFTIIQTQMSGVADTTGLVQTWAITVMIQIVIVS